jgi:hypothetical protein
MFLVLDCWVPAGSESLENPAANPTLHREFQGSFDSFHVITQQPAPNARAPAASYSFQLRFNLRIPTAQSFNPAPQNPNPNLTASPRRRSPTRINDDKPTNHVIFSHPDRKNSSPARAIGRP